MKAYLPSFPTLFGGSMGEIIEVIYENGVLKPLRPLKLKEGQRLRVRIYHEDFLELAREMRKKITAEKTHEKN